MKNTFFIFLFILSSISGFAQTDKGKVMLGGNTSYFYNKTNYSSSQATIIPSFGYFIKNNLAIGSDFTYTRYKNLYNSNNGINNYNISNGIGVSPFIRYYKFIENKLAFFGQANIGAMHSHSHYTENTSNPTSNTIAGNINLKPGLVYFISPKIGVELTFGGISYFYNHISFDNNSPEINSQNFNFNLGLRSLAIGAYIYL